MTTWIIAITANEFKKLYNSCKFQVVTVSVGYVLFCAVALSQCSFDLMCAIAFSSNGIVAPIALWSTEKRSL